MVPCGLNGLMMPGWAMPRSLGFGWEARSGAGDAQKTIWLEMSGWAQKRETAQAVQQESEGSLGWPALILKQLMAWMEP